MSLPTVAVVGQGIAGSLLAWSLAQRGVAVTLLSDEQPSASSVAAGLINPITGKRYVLSWRFPELYACARTTYAALERQLNQTFWHETPIIRLLDSPEALNTWNSRRAFPDVAAYLEDQNVAGEWNSLTVPVVGYGLLKQAARVDFSPLLRSVKAHFMQRGQYQIAHVTPADVPSLLASFDYVVFAEGYGSVHQSYFSRLPWLPAKGEALHIHIPHPQAADLRQTLKRNIAVIPQGQSTFWAGANYAWHFPDAAPTAAGRAFIQQELARMLAVPYAVVGHRAHVRAVLQDRRPVLGASDAHPRVYIFGALGSKGALLAPYWAEHLANHLIEGTPIEAAVDIARFS